MIEAMMFQTILDPMEVFEVQNLQSRQELQYKTLENKTIYGVKCKEGFKIQGLFSLDPHDYLSPDFEIGKII